MNDKKKAREFSLSWQLVLLYFVGISVRPLPGFASSERVPETRRTQMDQLVVNCENGDLSACEHAAPFLHMLSTLIGGGDANDCRTPPSDTVLSFLDGKGQSDFLNGVGDSAEKDGCLIGDRRFHDAYDRWIGGCRCSSQEQIVRQKAEEFYYKLCAEGTTLQQVARGCRVYVSEQYAGHMSTPHMTLFGMWRLCSFGFCTDMPAQIEAINASMLPITESDKRIIKSHYAWSSGGDRNVGTRPNVLRSGGLLLMYKSGFNPDFNSWNTPRHSNCDDDWLRAIPAAKEKVSELCRTAADDIAELACTAEVAFDQWPWNPAACD